VQVGRLALLETVTDWRPGELLSYDVSGLPPAAGAVSNTWRLAPSRSGTLASLTTEIDPPPGPPGRLVGRLLAQRFGRADAAMLSGLAHHLADHPADQPADQIARSTEGVAS
jgi:hypothetical protein